MNEKDVSENQIATELGVFLIVNRQMIPLTKQVTTLGRHLENDISDRQATEKLLKRNGRILSVISEATARLFRSPNIKTGISEVLEPLGNVLNVFGCVIFDVENFLGYPQIQILYQWLEPGVGNFDIETAIKPFADRMILAPNAVLAEIKAGRTKAIPEYSFLAIPIQGPLGSRGFLGMFDRENSLSWLLADFDVV